MGMLYQRGKTWWLKYYENGKMVRESARTNKKMVAKNLLEQRMGDIASGRAPGYSFDKVTYGDLSEGLLNDYRINGKKSIKKVEIYLRKLEKFFGGRRATKISTSLIEKYTLGRLSEGLAPATVNRELSALKRMFNLGARQTPPLVDRVPHIPMLKENNARKGFFEHNEFLAIRDVLPAHLQGVVTFAYRSGWRHDEITSLKWSQVDREEGIVRLEVGETKSNDGRTMYLDGELKQVIENQWTIRKQNGKILPYVFLNSKGTDRVKRFDKAWKNACKTAQIGVKIFHDFRRTAVRNMVRSGIPEVVAMSISGHKTRSVFDRYNIVNDQDLKQACTRLDTYLSGRTGTILGTIRKIGVSV